MNLQGTGGDVLILEEAAYCDEGMLFIAFYCFPLLSIAFHCFPLLFIADNNFSNTGFFYETIAPILCISRCCLVAISTLTSEINFYTVIAIFICGIFQYKNACNQKYGLTCFAVLFGFCFAETHAIAGSSNKSRFIQLPMYRTCVRTLQSRGKCSFLQPYVAFGNIVQYVYVRFRLCIFAWIMCACAFVLVCIKVKKKS